MYTKAQVDEMLLQVEQEFERTLESIAKNEKNQVIEESVEADSEEFETIDDLYASMTKNEIEAHYSSLKKVMMTKSEDESEEEKEESKEHEEKEKKKDKEHEEKEEMEKCGEMSAKKAERAEGRAAEPMSGWHKKVKEEGGHDEDDSPHAAEQKARAAQKKAATEAHGVRKSEQSLIEENEALKKNLESLNDLVSKLFATKSAPAQKAITATSFIAKSEELETEAVNITEMSKGEVTAKLKALDFQSLSKSDRDAINNFYLQNGSVEKIKHLISK